MMYRCNLIFFVCFHIDVLYTSEAVACRIDLTFSLCVYDILPVLFRCYTGALWDARRKKENPLCWFEKASVKFPPITQQTLCHEAIIQVVGLVRVWLIRLKVQNRIEPNDSVPKRTFHNSLHRSIDFNKYLSLLFVLLLICSMLYLARKSLFTICSSKLPCVRIALPFMSVSYQEKSGVSSMQNCGHRSVFLTEIETVWAALCMCLEIQKVRVGDGDDSSPLNWRRKA